MGTTSRVNRCEHCGLDAFPGSGLVLGIDGHVLCRGCYAMARAPRRMPRPPVTPEAAEVDRLVDAGYQDEAAERQGRIERLLR